jgi:hypothetical protein
MMEWKGKGRKEKAKERKTTELALSFFFLSPNRVYFKNP